MNKKLRRLSNKHTKKTSRRKQKLSKKSKRRNMNKRKTMKGGSTKTPRIRDIGSNLKPTNIFNEKLGIGTLANDLKGADLRVNQENESLIKELDRKVQNITTQIKLIKEIEAIKNPTIKLSVLSEIAYGSIGTPIRNGANLKRNTKKLLEQKNQELAQVASEIKSGEQNVLNTSSQEKRTKLLEQKTKELEEYKDELQETITTRLQRLRNIKSTQETLIPI